MKRSILKHLGLVAAAAAIAGCSDSTNPVVNTVSDAQVNADVAQLSGDAIATDVGALVTADVALPAPSFNLGSPASGVVRTCYSGGQVQAQCDANTTDSVRLSVQFDGSVSRSDTTPHGIESFSAVYHRSRLLSITGLTGTETFRTHNGAGTSSDTTTFSGTSDSTSRSRTMATAANDSVVGLVFTLPHNTHPWPTAGTVIRNVSGKITITGPHAAERTFSRRVQVTFPADNQGNVQIQINAKSCTLNLVTHKVANCSA